MQLAKAELLRNELMKGQVHAVKGEVHMLRGDPH